MFGLQMDEAGITGIEMSPQLHSAVLEYQRLETQVRLLIGEVCKSHCSHCLNRCCKKDFCVESIASPWLRLVWETSHHKIMEYDDSTGWLTDSGCRLNAGRPPVCYEFMCSQILMEISATDRMHTIKVLSKLVTFAGANALGKKHLVTLSSTQLLTRLNYTRLRRRLAHSQEILQNCEQVLNSCP